MKSHLFPNKWTKCIPRKRRDIEWGQFCCKFIENYWLSIILVVLKFTMNELSVTVIYLYVFLFLF